MSITSTTVARRAIQKRFVLISLFIGIFIYCIGDHFYHVKTNTLIYHWTPLIDGQSVWVWPIFIVGAAVMLGVAYLFSAKRTDPTKFDIISGFVIGHAIYLSSGLFGNANPVLFPFICIAFWLIRLSFAQQKSQVVIFSLLAASIGPLVEGLFSWFGLYDYRLQEFARVPWWLFAAYLHFGQPLLDLGRWVKSGSLQS